MVDESDKGRTFPPFSIRVEQGKLREFLLAIGDDNAAFLGEDAPLPPTFPTVFLFWGAGGLEGTLRELGVSIWNVLHAEQEYEYHAPVHVGDTVMGRTAITDVYERRGSSGAMTFVAFSTEYTNQHGTRVLTDRALIIVRDGAPDAEEDE